MNSIDPDPRIAFFDQHAPAWDSYGPPAEAVLERLDTLCPLLGLQAGERILEVGCGTGRVTAWLARIVKPGRVTALDFSPRMLEIARARGVDADFHCLDVCSDDLGEDRYDVAFCMHVVPHLRDHLQALRRLTRALKPGGRLIVLHLIGRERVNAIHAHSGGAVAGDRLPDPDHWRSLTNACGLSISRLDDRDDLFLLVGMRLGMLANRACYGQPAGG